MRWRRELGEWFIEHGYRFVANTKQETSFDVAVADPRLFAPEDDYEMDGVASVFTFEKPTLAAPESPLQVQLVIASHTPMEVILYFHSTCVMNVISYEKAYALYPRATFEERRSFICAKDSLPQEIIEKYSTRGWEMMEWLKLPEAQRNKDNRTFRFGLRRVSDSQSWIIALDMAGVVRPSSAFLPPLLQDPVGTASWKLRYNDHSGGSVDFDSFWFPILDQY